MESLPEGKPEAELERLRIASGEQILRTIGQPIQDLEIVTDGSADGQVQETPQWTTTFQSTLEPISGSVDQTNSTCSTSEVSIEINILTLKANTVEKDFKPCMRSGSETLFFTGESQ